MTYNKMIHDYLDTGLAQPEEDALFQALASDQALRGDFSQQLSIIKIAANDMNSISPPIETTNAVFSSLGFTIPSNGISPNAVASENRRKPGASFFTTASSTGILSLFKDKLGTIASIGIAAVISTMLFMSFKDNLPTNANQSSGITLAQNYNNVPNMNSIPVVSSFEKSKTIINNSRTTQRKKISTPIVDNKQEVFTNNANVAIVNNQDIAFNKENNNSNEDKYKNLKINENGYAIVRVKRFDTGTDEINQLEMPKLQYIEPTGFSLELRGANNNSKGTSVNDMQIGVNFEFIDNLYAVGMIGNEHYVVRVSNPISAAESVKYADQSMVSFMFGLRYAPDELILDGLLTPYIQASGSGLSNGFAGGFETGLMLNINQHYSLLMGYGQQFARYNFEGRLYNTDKSGVNVGIRYSF